MNGPKVNALTREQVRAAVAAVPPEGDYVWDGEDADDRPLSDAALQAGLAVAVAVAAIRTMLGCRVPSFGIWPCGACGGTEK